MFTAFSALKLAFFIALANLLLYVKLLKSSFWHFLSVGEEKQWKQKARNIFLKSILRLIFFFKSD